MRERYIAPTIMLVAGAITSILNVVNEVDMFEGLKRLFLILILFYIIGSIAGNIIAKAKNHEKMQEDLIDPIQTQEDQLFDDSGDIEEQKN